MSLLVWLPMTKDLRQQGLSNIAITNHNVTIDTNGKLGSCCYFNGSQQWLQFDTVLGDYYNNDWTIACWLKPTDSTRSVIISEYNGIGASNVAIELTTARIVRLYWAGTPDVNFSTAGALPLNEWTHIVMTKAGRVVKLYFNGELKQTYTSSSDLSTRTSACQPRIGDDYRGNSGNSVSYQGYMNDFRMYDHCLSPMEVKELSKGLVLHYPLNREGFGQENLATCTTSQYNLSASTGNYNYFWINSNTLEPNTTYTFSAEVEVSDNIEKCTIYNYTNSSNSGSITSTFPADGKRHSWTFTTTTTALGLIGYAGKSGATAGHSAAYRNIKIEKGNIATPYIPKSNEALYTTMGLNGTTEYDCSGYCNNLNRNGTYSYTSDTPKYEVSTVFNGTEWMNGTTPGAEILTLACWAKTTKNKSTSQFMVADSTSAMAIALYSGCIIGVFGTTRSTGSKSTLGSSYKENDWNHFVVVKTGNAGERAIYCNGELLTPTSNDYWSAATGFFIGSRNNSATLPFYGQICDVRAYATALSADDVKSLYQNSAYIDSSGNVYGAVHSEV